MYVYQILDHSAFPVPYSGHIDVEVVDANPELLAATNILCDLCGMNNILAGKTGNVRASSTDILAFHRCDALASSREGPGQQFRACATTKNEQIVNFRLRLKIHICCSPHCE